MELKPDAGSNHAWVWNTHTDFNDESAPSQRYLPASS
jgi:hypothetical protein